MKISLKLLLTASAVALLMSGCAQKVRIKALDPAEVGEMATKKKVAISGFKMIVTVYLVKSSLK